MKNRNLLPWAVLGLVALLAPAAFAADAPAAKPAPKKVVLIAGLKSHGPEGNGVHDYNWSVRLLRAMLERGNVKDAVRVEHHLNGWPADPKAVEDADCVVVISDGRDGDKYAEAQHLATPERVALMDKLAKRGCGLVVIHFSTFAPDAYGEKVLDWVGGYFDWETDGKRQWYSAIKTLEADVKVAPSAERHPVLRGVKPFRMKEEFYYNIRFAPDDKGTTKLLEVPDLKGREGDGNVVAWARQRPGGQAGVGGGRGFGTTCGHFYFNWTNDDFRRTVLNGIVWCAGAEVPAGGVESTVLSREEVEKAVPAAEKK
ncbi:MAG TPA: ThuA domain-containing protein [Humisphaera sp.]